MRNKRKVYSYDIFDTCLIRACGKSIFVFDVLAREVLGKNATISQIRDFSLIRINGEKRAKSILCNERIEDVTIDEIYQYCDFTSLTTLPNTEIINKELEVEESLILPVYSIQKEISEIHSSGGNVFFISDMYLSSSFISKLLIKYGFFNEGDKLYVSSDYKKTKLTGNLYKLVKEENGLDYKKWIHKGDNKISDYTVPRALGIRATQYRCHYSYYEELMISNNSSNTYMEALKLSSVSRAIVSSRKQSPYAQFSSDFVAPIYVPFVYHVMEDATKRGIKKLYFLARDGFILYKIAEELHSSFPNIALSYLYVSRVSLYLPGIKELTYQGVTDSINIKDRDIDEMLEIFRMPNFDYPKEEYSKMDVSESLRLLLSNNSFIEELSEKYTEQRTLCLDYFKQEGLTEGNCAIVDLVGTRRCQESINRILINNHYPAVFAYYFDIMPSRIFTGGYDAFNFQEMRPPYGNIFLGSQAILEQYFSITDQGRTIGYVKNNNLVAPEKEKVADYYSYANTVLNSNLDCCVNYARFYKILQPLDNRISEENALVVYSDFCYNPRREYLKALEDLRITSVTLNTKLLYKTSFLKLLLDRKSLWIWGCAIYNSGPLYRIVRFLLSCYMKKMKRKRSNLA